ncbi:DUF1996 domain-containing protein [Streptomyces sp. NBC_00887]|uniref:DUF1996 domain-containing protein n=1 Tax=Streptomyces sp. NBC_00887 TaxID=2975859 RepID=UPI00386F24BF|nr:DUF1996 domain-containing protein [Streptomyces sp. NBC_00887]
MSRSTRKRSKRGRRTVAASAALILGGGGLIVVNTYAAAGEGQGAWPGGDTGTRTQEAAFGAATVSCPELADTLTEVPEAARAEVDRELATLDSRITDAYRRFADRRQRIEKDPQVLEKEVLGPLRSERAAGIQRIASAVEKAGGTPPAGFDGLASCSVKADEADAGADAAGTGGEGASDAPGQEQPGDSGGQAGDGGGQAEESGGQAGNGPAASDFADITSVEPKAARPVFGPDASRGTFVTECGVNANGKFNPDNVIVAPGVSNGAHHMHDYVGNQANDAFASDDDLAAGATTCRDQGDRSTYYWPVLRLQDGQEEKDAKAGGGGADLNVGKILTPSQVTLTFVGSPAGRVTAMPRFLRIITGDAKAFVNGDKNVNASWSCTGSEDRQLRDKYPICPAGSQVVRTFAFQSCWDGRNTDSANHRTHVAFADGNGACPEGFRAIPQLVQRIVYNVPPPVFDGERPVVFALDSFPEQLHKPVTDHGDFINVFDETLMAELVGCLNEGRKCGAGDGNDEGGAAPGAGAGDPGKGEPDRPGGEDGPERPEGEKEPGPQKPPPADAPAAQPTADAPAARPTTDAPAARPTADKPAGRPTADGAKAERPTADEAKAERPGPPRGKSTEAPALPSGEGVEPSPARSAPARDVTPEAAPDAGERTAAPAPKSASSAPVTGGVVQNAGSAPQAGGKGALASTGAQWWPSAAGAVLLIVGVLLFRARPRRQATRGR